MKVYLVCDESGAKGRATNREQYPGETGVFAGFLVPEAHKNQVENALGCIVSRYSSDGKLHITDLELQQQQSLRDEVFVYLLDHKVYCTYEAIYVEGFRSAFKTSRK